VTPAAETERTWHKHEVQQVVAALGTTETGLASEEALRRLEVHGPNELQAVERSSAWHTLAAQFKNVLVVILLGATLLSGLLGHGLERRGSFGRLT
jgi:Ca2+-transporting ATPase